MSDMIERVARAIWDQRRTSAAAIGIDLEEWGDGGIPRANKVFEEAQAAIEAMRKPTKHMIMQAMVQPHPSVAESGGIIEQGQAAVLIDYQAMIDAALGTDKPTT